MKKRVLVVAGDLELGGGQIFAVRLANAMSQRASVAIMSADPARCDNRLVGRLDPTIARLDGVSGSEALAGFLAQERFDVVHSHLWQADVLVADALTMSPAHWVVSMHGCYEMLLAGADADAVFRPAATRVLTRADAVVIAAEKNRRVFERYGLDTKRVRRIPYGFEPIAPRTVRRPDADIVFGIASRAVPNKGWEQAVFAFERVRTALRERGMSSALVLVGGGPLVDILRDLKRADVHVVGSVGDPETWIAGFDIAMLPTSYSGESLPNSIIEYLAQGKAIIATRWAEIPSMLDTPSGPAGALIGLDDHGTADTEALGEAMVDLAVDAPLRACMQAAAATKSCAFAMDDCVRAYRDTLGI